HTSPPTLYSLSLHDALPILDKATLTLGDNRKVDLSRCVIFMTSNLGAAEMCEMLSGGIGFTSGVRSDEANLAEIDQKMYHTALRSEEHTSELQSLRHLVCRL